MYSNGNSFASAERPRTAEPPLIWKQMRPVPPPQ